MNEVSSQEIEEERKHLEKALEENKRKRENRPLSLNDKLCKTCTFFFNGNECHRFPPQIIANTSGMPATHWPHVTANNFCGEWREHKP